MKKILGCVLASLLAIAAFSQPVTDIKGGTDLAFRSIGGSVAVSGQGTTYTVPVLPSILVHISKAAGTLVATVPTGTLFSGSGVSTNFTFTGATDATTNGINWTVSDPGVIGHTITVNYNNTSTTFTVNSVSGSVYTVGTHVLTPVYDPFASVYRSTTISMDTSQTSSITISGTAGLIPVTVTLTPQFAGLGGQKILQFVNHVLLSSASVVSGQAYTGTVYLEAAAASDTTVTLSSNLSLTGSVTVPAGHAQANFTFTPSTIYSTTPSWIRAIAFGSIADEAITGLPLLGSITVNTAVPVAGAPVQFTVNLNGAAPTATTVTLRSDDPNFVLPPSVTVLAGQHTATFTGTAAVVPTANSVSGVTETYVSAQFGQTVVRAAVYLH